MKKYLIAVLCLASCALEAAPAGKKPVKKTSPAQKSASFKSAHEFFASFYNFISGKQATSAAKKPKSKSFDAKKPEAQAVQVISKPAKVQPKPVKKVEKIAEEKLDDLVSLDDLDEEAGNASNIGLFVGAFGGTFGLIATGLLALVYKQNQSTREKYQSLSVSNNEQAKKAEQNAEAKIKEGDQKAQKFIKNALEASFFAKLVPVDANEEWLNWLTELVRNRQDNRRALQAIESLKKMTEELKKHTATVARIERELREAAAAASLPGAGSSAGAPDPAAVAVERVVELNEQKEAAEKKVSDHSVAVQAARAKVIDKLIKLGLTNQTFLNAVAAKFELKPATKPGGKGEAVVANPKKPDAKK